MGRFTQPDPVEGGGIVAVGGEGYAWPGRGPSGIVDLSGLSGFAWTPIGAEGRPGPEEYLPRDPVLVTGVDEAVGPGGIAFGGGLERLVFPGFDASDYAYGQLGASTPSASASLGVGFDAPDPEAWLGPFLTLTMIGPAGFGLEASIALDPYTSKEDGEVYSPHSLKLVIGLPGPGLFLQYYDYPSELRKHIEGIFDPSDCD